MIIKTCTGCYQEFYAKRKETKTCSAPCVKLAISRATQKYSPEAKEKALELRRQNRSYVDILQITGVSVDSQKVLFAKEGVFLSDEAFDAAVIGARWKNHPHPIQNGKKQCSKCRLHKLSFDFGKDLGRPSGLTSECRQCQKAYNFLNRERINARVFSYHQMFPEKKKEAYSRYYQSHTAILIAKASAHFHKNRNSNKLAVARYAKSPKGKASKRAASALRRAIKINATPKWITDLEKALIKSFYANTPEGYHVDHIEPLDGIDRNGFHVLANLQYKDASENIRKSNLSEPIIIKKTVCHQFEVKRRTLADDVASGVTLNAEVRDFDLALESFSKEHREFIQRYEWMKTVGPSTEWVFTARLDGKLGGVVVIGDSITNGKLGRSIEAQIHRGATASWTPKNLGSRLLMFACRWVADNSTKRVFFGYSDPDAGEIGTIYQACNFLYLGNHFGAKTCYVLPNGKEISRKTMSRTSGLQRCAKELGIPWQQSWLKPNGFVDRSAIPQAIYLQLKQHGKSFISNLEMRHLTPKGKYVLFLGSKKETKVNKNTLGETLENYPKR